MKADARMIIENEGIRIHGDLEKSGGSEGKRIFLVLHGLGSFCRDWGEA